MAVVGKRVGPPSGLQLRAYHEAGHAVAALLKGFSLTRVTISRRGASTEKLLLRPEIWAVVHKLARRLLDARTLCGEHVVQAVLGAMATPGARRRQKATRRRADSSRRAREKPSQVGPWKPNAARRIRSSIPQRVSSE